MTDTPDDSRPHSKSEMRRLDAQKPREWRYVGKFISQQGWQYAIIEGPEFGEHKVRLVERSEYDRVCAERDEAKDALEQEVMRIEGLLRGKYEKSIRALQDLIQWLRSGIEHFNHDEDQSQRQHLIRGIDEGLARGSHMGMFDDEGTKK